MKNNKIIKYIMNTVIIIIVWVVLTLGNEFFHCHVSVLGDPYLCNIFKTINEYTIKAIYECIFD